MADIIFYDGNCPMCAGLVRFLIPRDKYRNFHYAPLGGETFQARFTQTEMDKIPDTLVVLRRDGTVLIRSTAVLYVLHRLGAGWGFLATVGMLFPLFIRDAVYRLV
ncbi:MAG: DUF393 domain-containing protein, partial [Candidatus Sumerlaeia bacterium]|nr:DUF393 domain-containing protein [Candidatus Sumerlaeia bacterium]